MSHVFKFNLRVAAQQQTKKEQVLWYQFDFPPKCIYPANEKKMRGAETKRTGPQTQTCRIRFATIGIQRLAGINARGFADLILVSFSFSLFTLATSFHIERFLFKKKKKKKKESETNTRNEMDEEFTGKVIFGNSRISKRTSADFQFVDSLFHWSSYSTVRVISPWKLLL